jgi:hypothetical protein
MKRNDKKQKQQRQAVKDIFSASSRHKFIKPGSMSDFDTAALDNDTS